MVTLSKYGAKYNRNILFLEGLSTDTKPTGEFDGLSIQNGSEYTEVDTGKKFLFDYDNATWYEFGDLSGLSSNNIGAMTGYIIAQTAGTISTSDTLNQAMGKIEKRVATNENNISLEQAKTTGMSEGGSNYITVGGIRVYVSATAPTGARTGDLWIGG